MENWLSGLFVLGGVILGAVLSSMFELWRRALDGQAAARIIRQELTVNATKVHIALEGKTGDMSLLDEAWKAHRLTLAPLLSEIDLTRLYREFTFLPQAKRWIDLLAEPKAEKAARENLRVWQDDLTNRGRELRQIESRSRLGLFLKLLWGHRTATQSELSAALGVEAQGTGQPQARRQAKKGGRAGPFAGAGHRGGGAEGAERGDNDART
jgi:hypothetical protein